MEIRFPVQALPVGITSSPRYDIAQVQHPVNRLVHRFNGVDHRHGSCEAVGQRIPGVEIADDGGTPPLGPGGLEVVGHAAGGAVAGHDAVHVFGIFFQSVKRGSAFPEDVAFPHVAHHRDLAINTVEGSTQVLFGIDTLGVSPQLVALERVENMRVMNGRVGSPTHVHGLARVLGRAGFNTVNFLCP